MRQYAIQYNHLGQLTQVTDDAGVRTIGYNAYGEQETDSLLAEGVTHLITETRDAMGRSTGFMYAKDGIVQHTVMTDYASDGRINSAGFVHEGEEKLFRYDYLPGSSLLHSLTHPNGVTLMQTYEAKRDLITEMLYINGNQTAASRRYEYDSMGHPTTRYQQQEERKQRDSFEYNSRSELTAASLGIDQYTYRYDNIGNRILAEGKAYTTNELNQYASVGDFVPQFDADGNQTLLKTETGVWQVGYNAENRPVRFTRVEGTSTTVVECAYDSMGRRATKKVSVNGSITLYQRFLYRGYLQMACCDLTRSNHPCLWIITWDPTQPIATRPLAIQKDGTWYTYGWDLTKNICEVYGQHGYLRTAYTYTPYGEVTAAGDVTQPIQWSSEFNDSELGLVYYNYRHYNPVDGRWLEKDIIVDLNLYKFCENIPNQSTDLVGLKFNQTKDFKPLSEIFKNRGVVAYTGSKNNRKGKKYGKTIGDFFIQFGISYNKKPYFDSNNYEIITEFNMDIVTEIPSDMPMTKKGKEQLKQHEENRVFVYEQIYDNFIFNIKKIKVKNGEIPKSKLTNTLLDMMEKAKMYAIRELGESNNDTGINSDNKYAIFRRVTDDKIISTASYMRMFIKNGYKIPECYIFDGFSKPLYCPVPSDDYKVH